MKSPQRPLKPQRFEGAELLPAEAGSLNGSQVVDFPQAEHQTKVYGLWILGFKLEQAAVWMPGFEDGNLGCGSERAGGAGSFSGLQMDR